jgi:proline dehydrogenase
MYVFDKLITTLLPFLPKQLVRKVSDRYIAGVSLDDAVSCVHRLNGEGAMATVDVLGEYISTIDEAEHNTAYSIKVLDTIAREKIDGNLSIKLTSLGLGIDDEICRLNVVKILTKAAENGGIFVRFDMEDSRYTTRTIELYQEMRKKFTNVGIVLQAYLKRTSSDLEKLLAEGKTNVRLCKGIYREDESIAFKERVQIQNNFLLCLEKLFSSGAYVGIATHDDVLIEGAKNLIQKYSLTINDYEFQMLLGVRVHVRKTLIAEGHRLRVYVPFGEDWYGYSLRRLKENPSIAGYVFKAMFTKN